MSTQTTEGTHQPREEPTKPCACVWYSDTEPSDARTCYELRYYGYSPVARGRYSLLEGGAYDTGDADDDECECPCHEDDDDNY